MDVRTVCRRCRRPQTVCYCNTLTHVQSRTRVVFLQHPKEAKVAVGTCRMAHLCLPNSELHVGVSFSDNARVEECLRDESGQTALLFPSEEAKRVEELPVRPSRLIVVDGTWSQASKLVRNNPALLKLPRVGLKPAQPGNYRIRKEPAEHCLATIEAVVEVLGQLEDNPDHFRPLLRAFDRMIEYQLAHIFSREGESRHKRARHRLVPKKLRIPTELKSRFEDLVLVYAEANAHPASKETGRAEMVHLLGMRPSTGERFEAIVAPRRPLSPSAPRHLELAEVQLLGGEDVGQAIDRWAKFLKPNDLLVTWGRYSIDLLESEAAPSLPLLDLRFILSQKNSKKAGGVEKAAADLNSTKAFPWTQGRAARRIACIERVLEALLDELSVAAA